MHKLCENDLVEPEPYAYYNSTFPAGCGAPITPNPNKPDGGLNVLEWAGACNWDPTLMYGFRTWISVPQHDQVESAHAWYFEILDVGKPHPEDKKMRTRYPAEIAGGSVKAMKNVVIGLESVTPGAETALGIDFELVTDLPRNGSIEIAPPDMYKFQFKQYYKQIIGQIDLATGTWAREKTPSCMVIDRGNDRNGPRAISSETDPLKIELRSVSVPRRYALPYKNLPQDHQCNILYYIVCKSACTESLPNYQIYLSRIILLGDFSKGKYALDI